MNVTEVLVNGFDGDETVFAAALSPGSEAKVLTVVDCCGSATVQTVSDVATSAFTTVQQVIEDLITVGSQSG